MAAPISLHHKYIWAVFLWLLLFPITLGGNRKAGLYEAEDDVVILVADNFYQTVLLSNKAWMVEFYSSWCGHCVNFAPTWKKFATDVKGAYCTVLLDVGQGLQYTVDVGRLLALLEN